MLAMAAPVPRPTKKVEGPEKIPKKLASRKTAPVSAPALWQPVPADFDPSSADSATTGPFRVLEMGQTHCARGAARCNSCRVFGATRQYVIIAPDGDYDGESARQCMEFDGLGHVPFVVIGSFEGAAAARRFAEAYSNLVSFG